MKKIIAWVCAALLATAAGLSAHGVDAGTVLVNNTLTNTNANFASATNAGNLSAAYSNSAGVVYNAFIKAPSARTIVTNGFDLSPVIIRAPGTNYASAGMNVYFTNWTTNWGNASQNIRYRLQKLAASAAWTNTYAISLNGSWVSSNAETVNNSFAGLAEGLFISSIIRVTVPVSMSDGSSNRFMLIVDDSAPFPGDQWPGKGAILPATQDTNNRRDYQTNYFLVKVAGPILDITKSVDITAGIRPFQVLTYTITVTNRGSATAFKVDVRDVLPVNVTNIAGTVRAWTNSAVSSNLLAEGSGDGDMLFLTNKILKVKVPQVLKGKTARIRFEVKVK